MNSFIEIKIFYYLQLENCTERYSTYVKWLEDRTKKNNLFKFYNFFQ